MFPSHTPSSHVLAEQISVLSGDLLQGMTCLRELHMFVALGFPHVLCLCVCGCAAVCVRLALILIRPWPWACVPVRRYQNKITTLPPEIMCLPDLEHLTLSKCVGGRCVATHVHRRIVWYSRHACLLVCVRVLACVFGLLQRAATS